MRGTPQGGTGAVGYGGGMPMPGRLRKCRRAHIAWWNVSTAIAAAANPNIARTALPPISASLLFAGWLQILGRSGLDAMTLARLPAHKLLNVPRCGPTKQQG